MFKKTSLFLVGVSAVSAMFISSQNSNAGLSEETQAATTKLGAASATEISFDEGRAVLKKDELAQVDKLIKDAKRNGKIDEVKVLSWADREYPAEGEKASKASVRLAEQRAERIKNYLKQSLKVDDVEIYNMAQRPNSVQKLFKTSDAKVKNTVENSGAAPTHSEDTGLFGLKGKSSDALVLVYMED